MGNSAKNTDNVGEVAIEEISVTESVESGAASTRVHDPLVLAEAEKVTHQYMLGALGVGIIPLPVVDFLGVTALQLKLVSKLSKIYGVEYSSRDARTLITSLIGGAAPAMAAMPVASFARMIPVVGWSLGGATMSILSGASTYAVGHIFIDHFEKGTGLLDINSACVKEKFADYYQAVKAKISRKKTVVEPVVEPSA